MTTDLTSTFQSNRLIFRGIEDTDEEKSWFHNHIKTDPVGYALGDSGLLRPQIRSRSNATLESISKELLGVMICLKPIHSGPQTTSTTSTQSSQSASASTDSALQRIGVLSLSDEASDSYRHHHRLGVLSIRIADGYQNHGYGSEAISWATNWAFQKAGLHTVSLGCVEYNERAAHLYSKLGFVQEGKFRKSHFHERQWWDVLLFSMLEDEWEDLQRKKEGVCKYR